MCSVSPVPGKASPAHSPCALVPLLCLLGPGAPLTSAHARAPRPPTADDCTVRLWEVRTGRCMRVWQMEEPVSCVAWCTSPQLALFAGGAAPLGKGA